LLCEDGKQCKSKIIKLLSGLETLQSTTDWIQQSGFEPSTVDKRCTIREATRDEMTQFEWELQPFHLIEVSRIRTADGLPITYSVDRIPVQLFANPDTICDVLLKEESLLRVLDDEGVYITHAVAKIKSVVHETASQIFCLESAHSVLWLHQIHQAGDGQPCLLSDIYIHPNKLEMKVVRRRVE
jgi:DNA-binding GntR family transcriptional regulator